MDFGSERIPIFDNQTDLLGQFDLAADPKWRRYCFQCRRQLRERVFPSIGQPTCQEYARALLEARGVQHKQSTMGNVQTFTLGQRLGAAHGQSGGEVFRQCLGKFFGDVTVNLVWWRVLLHGRSKMSSLRKLALGLDPSQRSSAKPKPTLHRV